MMNLTLGSLISGVAIHLAAASFCGWWLLNWLDERRRAAVPKLLLALLATVLLVQHLLSQDDSSAKLPWMICLALATIAGVLSIAQWRRDVPSEVFQEQSLQSQVKSSKRAKQTGRLPSFQPLTLSLSNVLGLAGSLLAMAAIWWQSLGELNQLSLWPRLFATLQSISVTGLLGLASFLCAELIFLSSPDALRPSRPTDVVNWRAVSVLALMLSLCLVGCVLSQFLTVPDQQFGPGKDQAIQIAARVFGLMLLMATFVLWMIPRRIAKCQRDNTIPPDWFSLTLSAMLGLLAMTVVAALPITWPWNVLK